MGRCPFCLKDHPDHYACNNPGEGIVEPSMPLRPPFIQEMTQPAFRQLVARRVLEIYVKKTSYEPSIAAKRAVAYADALIKELV